MLTGNPGYQSGFSPEDLPSNSAGANFGTSIDSNLTMAENFRNWADGAGALPMNDPASGLSALPATDPSYRGAGAYRGSNTSSAPIGGQTPPQIERWNPGWR